VKATVAKTDTLVKHQKKVAQIEEKQAAISPANKAKVKEARRLRWAVGREKVFISRIVRELKYTALERKRLLDKVQQDRGHHAHVGAPDSLSGAEVRSLEERGHEEGVPAPAEELPEDLEKIEGDAGRIDCGAQAHTARDDPGRHGLPNRRSAS